MYVKNIHFPSGFFCDLKNVFHNKTIYFFHHNKATFKQHLVYLWLLCSSELDISKYQSLKNHFLKCYMVSFCPRLLGWKKKPNKQTNKNKKTTKKLSNPTNKLIVVECFTFKESVLIERDVFFLLEDEPHLLFLDPGCPSEVGVLGKDVPWYTTTQCSSKTTLSPLEMKGTEMSIYF